MAEPVAQKPQLQQGSEAGLSRKVTMQVTTGSGVLIGTDLTPGYRLRNCGCLLHLGNLSTVQRRVRVQPLRQ